MPISALVEHHARHPCGVAWCRLMLTFGVAASRSLATGHGQQHVARLGVGGGDRQVPLSWALYCSPMRFRLPTSRMMISMLCEHMLAGFGDPLEALAMAREDVHAQFFFQLDDGLGYPRLRGAALAAPSG